MAKDRGSNTSDGVSDTVSLPAYDAVSDRVPGPESGTSTSTTFGLAQRGRATVCVVGAGLSGMSTAFELAQRGHKVTVIDKAPGPARVSSYLNGGLLCPSLSLPWPSVPTLRKLVRSLAPSQASTGAAVGPGAAPRVGVLGQTEKFPVVKLETGLLRDISFLKWCSVFIGSVLPWKFNDNFHASARLSLYSMATMEQLKEVSTPSHGGLFRDEYRAGAYGTLNTFADAAVCSSAFEYINGVLASEGGSTVLLSGPQCVEKLPFLASVPRPIGSGIFSTDDRSGDIHAFVRGLHARCLDLGVEFRFGACAVSADIQGDRVVALHLKSGTRIEADAFVVATGGLDNALAQNLSDGILIQMVRGYAVEVPVAEGMRGLLTCNLVDDAEKIYASPLGDTHVRLSGFVEFEGGAQCDSAVAEKKAMQLLRTAQAFFPDGYFCVDEPPCYAMAAPEDYRGPKWYSCLRPTTPDDLPVIGPSGVATNVWYNVGQGHLGWTRCVGSSRLLVDLMEGKDPDIDPAPYAATRFTWAGRFTAAWRKATG